MTSFYLRDQKPLIEKVASFCQVFFRYPRGDHHHHLHRVQTQVPGVGPSHEADAEPDGHAGGQGRQGVQRRYVLLGKRTVLYCAQFVCYVLGAHSKCETIHSNAKSGFKARLH